MTEIYLVRHGETFAKTNENELGKPFVCGSGSDISRNTELTENGKVGMRKVGEAYNNTNFDVCIISDLIRSRQSAEEFLKGAEQNVMIEVNKDVTEIDYGKDDGVSEEFIKNKKKNFFSNPTKTANDYDRLRGGETFEQAGTRMKKTLLEIAQKYSGKKVLVVSHSGAMRALYLSGVLQATNPKVIVGQDLNFGEVIHLRSDGENLEIF